MDQQHRPSACSLLAWLLGWLVPFLLALSLSWLVPWLLDAGVEKNESKLPCSKFFFCLVPEDVMLLVMLVIKEFEQYEMK